MTTFHWPKIDRSSWWLAGFIFLSLIVHSAAFFLFQSATPIRPAAPRPARPVQLLTPFAPDGTPSPENEALLAWITTEDPALVARVPSVEPTGLLAVAYSPSYATMRTAPLGVAPEPDTVQFPSARDPLSLILGNQASRAPEIPRLAPLHTAIHFSAELASRAPATAFSPGKKVRKAVESTRMLVGINEEGEVRFHFLQQPSSGDAALDAEAMAFVHGLRFAPSPNAPITWGFVTFQWGDDASATEAP